MKTVQIWIFLGVLVASLLHGRVPLQAQPASNSVPAGKPDPTDDSPDPADDEPDPTDDEPIVTDESDKPWSQGVPLESRIAARKLFLEGNRLSRIPLFAKAADQYAAALSKWKHPAFYFNLALAQLNLGKEIEARENLERALQHGEEPLGAEQFKEAQKQLREVKRQLGQVRVTCRTPGAEVTMNGVTLFIGPGSYQGWTKAKTHEITAKKAGYVPEARRVTVSSERLHDIELKLVTLTEATDASRRWAAWKPWVVIAAGGAVSAAGGGLHALASRSFNDYDAKFGGLDCAKGNPPPGCPKDNPDLADLNAQLKLARREQFIAVGGYIVGGSLLATGVVLLYLNRPRLAEQGTASSSARSTAVVPAVSGDMLGILVRVSH